MNTDKAVIPPLGGMPGHVTGVCDTCHRGGKTRRGLCAACFSRLIRAGAKIEQPRISSIELANEVIRVGGSRDPADLAKALGFTTESLGKRLMRYSQKLLAEAARERYRAVE